MLTYSAAGILQMHLESRAGSGRGGIIASERGYFKMGYTLD